MLKSTNREDLEKWLRAQPREVSVAIAARAALRVFPALDGVFNASRMKTASAQELSGVFIYVFQSIAFPVGAVRYPRAAETLARTVIARPAVRSTAYLDAAAFAAHTALVAYLDASEVAKHQILNNASDPAGFAAMATNSALSVFRSGAGNNAAARLASNTADSDLWLVINSDKSFIDGGGTAQQLAARPLWPASVPGLISEDWGNLMSELLALNEGWEVWTTWYDAVLQGKPTPGGEELDIFRVLLNEESDWEKGPKHVNGLIRAKEEEIALRSSLSATSLDLSQYPASFNFDFLNEQIVAKPVLGGERDLPDADDIRVHLVGKFNKAADRLSYTQCSQRYPDTFRQAAELMASKPAAQLRAGEILMMFRSMEADAAAIMSPDGRAEFTAEVIALVEDALRSFEDFKAQLPNVIKLETNRLALHLATSDAAAVNAELDLLAASVIQNALVADSAALALAEGNEEFLHFQQTIDISFNTLEVAAAKEAQSAIVAQRAMIARNFVVRPLKFLSDNAIAGIGNGIEKSAQGITVAAVSSLIASLAGPFAGMAVFIASFIPLAKRAQEVRDNPPPQDIGEA